MQVPELHRDRERREVPRHGKVAQLALLPAVRGDGDEAPSCRGRGSESFKSSETPGRKHDASIHPPLGLRINEELSLNWHLMAPSTVTTRRCSTSSSDIKPEARQSSFLFSLIVVQIPNAAPLCEGTQGLAPRFGLPSSQGLTKFP